MQLARDLMRFTDEPGRITRLYLSPAHRSAAQWLQTRMEQAGLRATIDAVGNVTGVYDGLSPDAPRLIVGSHIDTVIDAGAFDGVLGVACAIVAVEYLARHGVRLPFAIEIVAFGDEENVRFPTEYSTSAALAGAYRREWLETRDAAGVSLAEALRAFGGNPDGIAALARPRKATLGYLELHIEQGPELERNNLPLGIVSAIAGIRGVHATVTGMAGHAGTVPMLLRRDALTAVAEMILSAERIALERPGIVATTGRLTVEPGAINVISGKASFTLDLRSAEDAERNAAWVDIERAWRKTAETRGITLDIETIMDAPATAMDDALSEAFTAAVARLGVGVHRLLSGAGHDAAVMATLCPAAMLFVRCKDGVSHHPAESVRTEDVDLAVRALLATFAVLVDTH